MIDNKLNLDALKADIANNEIRVLVNGQPETVEYRKWCKDMAEELYKQGYLIDMYDMFGIVRYIANGGKKLHPSSIIISLLDY